MNADVLLVWHWESKNKALQNESELENVFL